MSTGPGLPPMQLIINMPIWGQPNVPYFNKTRARQYLDTIKRHGDAAGITGNDLVDYIYYYACDEVQDTIRYMPEFDTDLDQKDWSNAVKMFITLFGSSNKVLSVMLQDLRKFCQKQSAKSSFSLKAAIDRYHQSFQKFTAPLVKEGTISDKERDYYFIAGIPKDLKEWFRNLVPITNRMRANPPSIIESVKFLYTHFDTDSLIYEPWNDEDDNEDLETFKLDDEGL